MTPTEFRDHVESVLQEGFRMLLVLLVAIAIYLIFIGFAMATTCLSKPHDKAAYWQYRLIDGKKCWYRGEERKSKSELHWPPPKNMIDPLFNKIHAEASALDAVTWHMARPFDQAAPFSPPLLYNPNDIPEPECCWPDLSEFEKRFTGEQP